MKKLTVQRMPAGRPMKNEDRLKLTMMSFKADEQTRVAIDRLVEAAADSENFQGVIHAYVRRALIEAATRLPNPMSVSQASIEGVPSDRVTALIYGLFDPRDNNVYYVGQVSSFSGLKRRLETHICDARTNSTKGPGRLKIAWISELRKLGLVPRIQLLEEVNADDTVSERRWIERLALEGAPLTNYQFMPLHMRLERRKLYPLRTDVSRLSKDERLAFWQKELKKYDGNIVLASANNLVSQKQGHSLTKKLEHYHQRMLRRRASRRSAEVP